MNDLELFMEAPVATVIFVITIITSIRAFQNPLMREKMLFIPYNVQHMKEYYRLFTSGLIHANGMHLGMNMIAFYFFAFYLELQIGHWQFAVLYVGSLLLSDLPSMIRHNSSSVFRSLGASGAVSGVVMSMILLAPDMQLGLIFIPFFSLPAWLFGLLYMGYSFYASFKGRSIINHDAHLWGGIAGILITLLLQPESAANFINWMTG